MPNSVDRPTRVPMICRNCRGVDALLDVVRQVEVRVVERIVRCARLRGRLTDEEADANCAQHESECEAAPDTIARTRAS